MRRKLATLGALALLSACHEKASPLTPDLTVEFRCARVPSAEAIGAFMTAHGFAFHDVEAARRKTGRTFFPLQVVGTNARRAIFEVIGLKEPPSFGGAIDYRLTILSPPPTAHDPELETETAKFPASVPGCRVVSTFVGANDAASTAQFDLVLDDVLRKMRGQGVKPPR